MISEQTINILGVNISAVNPVAACERMDQWVVDRTKTYVCVAPVATIVDCQKDEAYRDVVNHAGMITPDGMPLVWIAKSRGNKTIQRTYGPDLMLDICRIGQDKGYRHFFYGGSEQVCKDLQIQLLKRFPKMKIVGGYSPPFRSGVHMEDQTMIDQINESKPDFLWIGLGAPKQDFWMAKHRDVLDVPVMVGIGAAFDFLAGHKPQAPKLLQRLGLEWLFRLCCEPRRLWKRYLIGNSQFIYWLSRDMFKFNNKK